MKDGSSDGRRISAPFGSRAARQPLTQHAGRGSGVARLGTIQPSTDGRPGAERRRRLEELHLAALLGERPGAGEAGYPSDHDERIGASVAAPAPRPARQTSRSSGCSGVAAAANLSRPSAPEPAR